MTATEYAQERLFRAGRALFPVYARHKGLFRPLKDLVMSSDRLRELCIRIVEAGRGSPEPDGVRKPMWPGFDLEGLSAMRLLGGQPAPAPRGAALGCARRILGLLQAPQASWGESGPDDLMTADADAILVLGATAWTPARGRAGTRSAQRRNAEVLRYVLAVEPTAMLFARMESIPAFEGEPRVIFIEPNYPLGAFRGLRCAYSAGMPSVLDALLSDVPVRTVTSTRYAALEGVTHGSDPEMGNGSSKGRTSLAEFLTHEQLCAPGYTCPLTGDAIDAEAACALLLFAQIPTYTVFFERTFDRPVRMFSRTLDQVTSEADQQWRNAILAAARQCVFGQLLADLAEQRPLGPILGKLATRLDSGQMIDLFASLLLHLRDSVRYDAVRDLIDTYVEWFEGLAPGHRQAMAPAFFEVFNVSLKHLNGRTIARVPHVDPVWRPDQPASVSLVQVYFQALVSNLEYDRARAFIDSLPDRTPLLVFRLSTNLRLKPYRVEHDQTLRARLAADLRREMELALGDSSPASELSTLISEALFGDNHSLLEAAVAIRDAVLDVPSPRSPEQRKTLSLMTTWSIGQVFRFRDYALCRDLISVCEPFLRPNDERALRMKVLFAEGSSTDLLFFVSENADLLSNRAYASELAGLAWRRNAFEVASRIHARFLTDDCSIQRQVGLANTLERLRFLSETSAFVNSVRQPVEPKGFILLASLNCYNTLAMVAPVLVELKRMGFAVGSLMEGVLRSEPLPSYPRSVARLFNSIQMSREDGRVLLAWSVNWAARDVSCLGINFYQGIYERLSTLYRRATISLDDEPVRRSFDHILKCSDYVLRQCLEIETAVAETSMPIVLLGSNSHVAPYSILRDFALARRLPNLRYVVASVAYENYYTNLGSKTSHSMAIVDMSLHRTCRAPFLAIRERFDAWYATNEHSPEVDERFARLLSADRSRRDEHVQAEFDRRIAEAHHAGRRIVCCFGKILCDLAVPYDGGPGHADMIDWLRHTVDVAAVNPDVLLLIKPHPHELRPEIALELTERIQDVLDLPLPSNVVLLPHDAYNVRDLATAIDVAVLWNGTSCLELTGLGVPVVMCSHFGRHDYPIDLVYPADRDHYARLISSEPLDRPPDALRRRAMALLYYMGTREVAIPNRYSRRPITNDNVGIPRWDHARLRRYRESGDPYIRLAAERVLEGVRVQGAEDAGMGVTTAAAQETEAWGPVGTATVPVGAPLAAQVAAASVRDAPHPLGSDEI